MNRVSVSITNFGIQWDDRFDTSLIPKAVQDQIDEAKSAIEASTPGNYPESESLNPASLIATQAELDFKRLTELVNEPSDKPVLVMKLKLMFETYLYILDGHHRVVSAKLRGVLVKAVVVGGV